MADDTKKVTVGMIGFGNQAGKIAEVLANAEGNSEWAGQLSDVNIRVYSPHSDHSRLESKLKGVKARSGSSSELQEDGWCIDGSDKLSYNQGEGGLELDKEKDLDNLERLVDKSDVIVVSAAEPFFADTLFEGIGDNVDALYGRYVEVYKNHFGKDYKPRDNNEFEELKANLERGKKLYEALKDKAGIKDFRTLGARKSDGKLDRDSRKNMKLDPDKVKELADTGVDYRALRFLPRSAFTIKESAEKFKALAERYKSRGEDEKLEKLKNKKIVMFSNQTDFDLYIFAENSELYDNVFGVNHTETYRLKREGCEIPSCFVGPRIHGHHSFPSLIFPGKISSHFVKPADAKTEFEKLKAESRRFAFYSVDNLETWENLGQDAAEATVDLIAAMFDKERLVTPGVLMILGSNPLYKETYSNNLEDLPRDAVFPASWSLTFTENEYGESTKQTLELFTPPTLQEISRAIARDKHSNGHFSRDKRRDIYEKPMKAWECFMGLMQDEFAQTYRSFEKLRQTLALDEFSLVSKDGIKLTEEQIKAVGHYGSPSPIEVGLDKEPGAGLTRGQTLVDRLGVAATRAGQARKRAHVSGSQRGASQVISPEELDAKLAESLDASVYLPSSESEGLGKLTITKYQLRKSLKPTTKNYVARLREQDVPGVDLIDEHSRMEICNYKVRDGKVYVLARRKHSDEHEEYRLFVFNEKSGGKEFVSSKIDGSDGEGRIDHQFKIGGFTVYKGDILMAKKDMTGNYLCRFSTKDSSLEPVQKLDHHSAVILPYNEQLLTVSGQDFYLGDKSVHNAGEPLGGYFKLWEEEGVVFYSTGDALSCFDLEGKYDPQSFPSHWSLNDVVELGNGVQLITGKPGVGVEVTNYNSKGDLFANTVGSNFPIDSELKDIHCLWAQGCDLFYAARDPDTLFGVYHEGNNSRIKPITTISGFKSLGGSISEK